MKASKHLHPSVRSLMEKRLKRLGDYRGYGISYSSLIRRYVKANEELAIDNLVIEAARSRVQKYSDEKKEESTPIEAAARASRIYTLFMIMHNYDECGTSEMWERDPNCLVSLIREFQLYVAHAIIGTPEILYSFGSVEEYKPANKADERLAEYAEQHGWLVASAEGGVFGDAYYVIRNAKTLGMNEDSTDDEIGLLYDSFTSRMSAYVASSNINTCPFAKDFSNGFACEGDHDNDYDTSANVAVIFSELSKQAEETKKDNPAPANIEDLGRVLDKTTEYYNIAACDISLGYTVVSREEYMGMIDELLGDLKSTEFALSKTPLN